MEENRTAARPFMHPVFGDARRNWGWMLGLGILSLILGIIGLGMAFTLTLAGVLFFGVLLAIGGAFQLVNAFTQKGWKGTLLNLLIALVYLATGGIMIVDPLGAAVALTLVIGVALIVVGVMRIWMAFQHRPAPGWGWALAGGILSILLGALVLAGWPVSGLWLIGLIIAVELIVNGWTYVFFGLAARRAAREGDDGTAATGHA